jgi:hypothetical protein
MTIALNDGSEYPITWCGAADDLFHAEICEPLDVLAAAEKFSQPDATGIITRVSGSTRVPYEGYTNLLSVKRDRFTKNVYVVLEKGA